MKKSLRALMPLLVVFLYWLTSVSAAGTYTLVIKAVDTAGDPLSAAWVRVTTLYGPGDYRSSYELTNASGVAVFSDVYSSIPSAIVTIYWRSVEVAYETVDLSDNVNSFVIVCDVSDLEVLTQDGESRPLKGAEVTIHWEKDIPQTLKSNTNDQGLAVFPQMPYYEYSVQTNWLARQVHDSIFNFNNSTTSYIANCSVYSLDVMVFDKEDHPISGAKVAILRDDEWEKSTITEVGIANFPQLSFGNYLIEASYESSSNTTTIQLTKSTEATLHLNITVPLRTFEIDVHAVWSDNKPMSGAKVFIRDNLGRTVSSGITDDNGFFTDLLSEGEYILNVSKNDLSKTENVNLRSNVTITVQFDADLRTYTLTVKVADKDGTLVDGALVKVKLNETLILNGETTEGIVAFNLKEETYRIIVRIGEKQREKTVELTEDTTISITFQRDFTLELLFYILTTSVVLTIIFLVFYARRLMKKGE
ncbi:hypothetical protein DRO69_02445 [Candidatus Bathyarchaeota archaeon]|nr:MAG: hypothetical protein DRO69_02445 [Candidatus Bathyarchaeota archaeon]